jgi:hypothetical protein
MDRSSKALKLAMLVACPIWVLIGFWLIPSIIRAAYTEQSLAILNSLIKGRDVHPVDYYLQEWRIVWIVITAALALLLLQASLHPRQLIKCFMRSVGSASAETLGAIRILVFGILLANVLWEHLPTVSFLPLEFRRPLGVMKFLQAIPGWNEIYSTPAALFTLKAITCIVLFSAALGMLTRLTAPLGVFLAIVHGGMLREYSWFYHTGIAPIYLGIALAFLPSGHGLSLDNMIFPSRNRRQSPAVYAWSRYICWIIVSAAYTMAGLSKLRNYGFWWWHGENLKHIVLTDTFNPMQFEWGLERALADLPVSAYSVLGAGALLSELTYGLVLISAKARRIIPPVTASMHVGILFFQGILFFDLILIQLIFWDWSKPVLRILNSPLEHRGSGEILRASDQAEHVTWARRCIFLVTALLLWWSLALEFYPLTSFQMYSSRRQIGVLEYRKVVAGFGDGREETAHPEQWIGALADSRSRAMTGKSKAPLFLAALRNKANRDAASPDEYVESFRVEYWRWNYADHPDSPTFGTRVAVIVEPPQHDASIRRPERDDARRFARNR